MKKLAFLFCMWAFLPGAIASGAPWGLPRELSDSNMKIAFEVHAPWNILDGSAEQVAGKLSLTDEENPGTLHADVSAQDIDYKAGLSVAGRLVSVWLRANPPTPARFVIAKSSLTCTPETIAAHSPCKGSVDGQLTIWGKAYKIDIPIQMTQVEKGFLLEGTKKIEWGQYGFGDPESTLADLKPVIELEFSVELLAEKIAELADQTH